MKLPLVSVSTKQKTKSSLWLTLSAATLLIAGGGGAVWFLTQGNPVARSLPQGVTVIPQDALFTVSLTTDENQWQSLRGFGTKQLQTELDQNLVKLRDRFISKYGYNFRTDIQPWVGNEVTIAVLPPKITKNKSKSETTDITTAHQAFLVVLPIKNPQTSKNILANIKAPDGKTWRDRLYQNVNIKETTTSSGEELAVTVLDGGKYLAIADNNQAINRAIDAKKQQTVLANLPGFADNFTKASSYQPFAQFYLNVPSSAKIASALPNRQLPAQILGQLQDNLGVVGTMTVEAEGVRVKAVSWLKSNSQRTLAIENNASTMQSRVPADTMMLLSGSNLRRFWTDYVTTSQGNPLSPFNPDELRKGFKSLTNLELERDFLSWMGGEFALSVIPVVTDNNFRPVLLFMVQVRDRSKAEAAMKQLDEAIRTQYQFKIQSKNVAGSQVVQWFAPLGTLTASHGWLTDNVKFLAIGAPVATAILPQIENPLQKSPLYQTAVPSTFNPGSGLLFIDVESIAKNFPIPPLFPNQQALLAATSTIGISSYISDNRSMQYEALIRLRKGDQPAPLPAPVPTTVTP